MTRRFQVDALTTHIGDSEGGAVDSGGRLGGNDGLLPRGSRLASGRCLCQLDLVTLRQHVDLGVPRRFSAPSGGRRYGHCTCIRFETTEARFKPPEK